MEGYDEGIKDAEDNRKRNVQVCRTNIIIILLLLNKNLSDRSTFLNYWWKKWFLKIDKFDRSISVITKYVDWFDWFLNCLFNRWTNWQTGWLIGSWIVWFGDWLIDWLIDLLRLLVWGISLVSIPQERRSTPPRTILYLRRFHKWATQWSKGNLVLRVRWH